MKKFICFLIIFSIFSCNIAYAEGLSDIKAESAILMDGKSGKVLYEKNADVKLPPASITKIMTMLLIMEALDNGTIKVEDMVTVSKTAATKEGSHIFLAEGEQMSVNDLLKGIAVASGNDAAMAMAEHLNGTQEKFVEEMNKKAQQLGMKNTHFVNCNGLDVDNHFSTARDIAIMTLELLKHPKIFEYTTIWMDTLRNGQFGLANTNKLIRFYKGANGMKTGSTSKAKYCLSATALRDDMQLIAVVMASPSTKDRFADGSNLLNYGFNSFAIEKKAAKGDKFADVTITKGVKPSVPVVYNEDFSIVTEKGKKDTVKSISSVPETFEAPLLKGQKVGEIKYYENDKEVGKVDLIANEDVGKVTFMYILGSIVNHFFSV